MAADSDQANALRRARFLAGLAEHVAKQAIAGGLAEDLGLALGNAAATLAASHFNNEHVYFVKDLAHQRSERDEQICREIGTGLASEVAARHGISCVRVQQIVRRHREKAQERAAAAQAHMFSEPADAAPAAAPDPSGRHSSLSVLAYVIARLAHEHGLPETLADDLGDSAADWTSSEWGGQGIYFPKELQSRLTRVDHRLCAELEAGASAAEVAQRAGLDELRVKQTWLQYLAELSARAESAQRDMFPPAAKNYAVHFNGRIQLGNRR
ncbi:Mor transcription activator family protein [Pseudacidovorax intermedius]|uniref:Mor transcription activator family protein n=1 Tax=Pseudacidovorax intermedius TaxID=433924 RepID=UPI0026EE2A81|nr:Mor transcription activator family protein [Pseudacidovorax intermedius]